MSENYQEWRPDAKDLERFEKWRSLAEFAHDEFHFLSGLPEPPLVNLDRSLSDCKVALISTAGIHRDDQEEFNLRSPYGDWSYREIPADTPSQKLCISHSHFNHAAAKKDINCLYPLERLRELAQEGFVKAVADINYGLMGFIPNPAPLINDTAPKITQHLKHQSVDIILLTPG